MQQYKNMILGSEPILKFHGSGGNKSQRKYNVFNWPMEKYPDFDSKITKIFKIIEKSKKYNYLGKYNKKKTLYIYQHIVGEYMIKGLYRGLLLYHGLGSGKTITATNIISNLDMNTIILLPAALRSSWINKYIKKFARQMMYKIKFISYNAPNLIEQYNKINPEIEFKSNINAFDDKLIVIDESHEFFQHVVSGKASQAMKIFEFMMDAKNAKFLFLTGTPIVGDPIEIVPMFNLLKGYLTNDKKHLLFPSSYDMFYSYFVDLDNNDIKNPHIIKERLTGLISYYPGIKDPTIVAEMIPLKIVNIVMGETQWKQYLLVKQTEIDLERKSKYKVKKIIKLKYKKPFKEAFGTFKVQSSKVCNFAFPLNVEKIYKKISEDFLKPNGCTVGKKIPSELWNNIEIDMKLYGPWPIKHEVAEIKWKIMNNIYTIKEIYKMLPLLSTKLMKLMLNIKKYSGRKKFIYSRWKVLGTRIISKFLEVMGYTLIKSKFKLNTKKKRFIIIDGDTTNRSDLIKLFNNKHNFRGEYCEIILGTEVIGKGISLTNIIETHILEPQWKNITIKQIRGRGVRTLSHIDLPLNERRMYTYIYISIPRDRNQLVKGKLTIHESDKLSTDEYIYQNSLKRAIFHEKFLTLLKESAIDCNLYNKNGSLNCKTYPKTIPHDTILFPSDYKKHIFRGPICYIKKKKKIDIYHLHDDYYCDNEKRLYIKKKLNKKVFYEEIGYITEDNIYKYY